MAEYVCFGLNMPRLALICMGWVPSSLDWSDMIEVEETGSEDVDGLAVDNEGDGLTVEVKEKDSDVG